MLISSLLISLIGFSQDQNISNGNVFDGEPYITTNPTNSQHIVVAWMGFKLGSKTVIKTRTSFDGGQTWSPKIDLPHSVSNYQSADPSLAFDNNGNLYLAYVDFLPFPTAGAVFVAKSINGGLNWGIPVEVINSTSDGSQKPVDRPWMAVDVSGGINDGNIYITTMNPAVFGPVPSPYNPYFIKSTNNGTSFEPWRYMDTINWLAGPFIPQPMPTPTVSANGTFHAIYPSLKFSQNLSAQFILASSNSAGNTFNYNSALIIAQSDTNSLPKKGYKLTANPADENHLLFAYPDITNGDLDVFIVESIDAGVNWSAPIRVNDDPIANNRMQDLIWVDFDTDGDVVVSWRDRRNASDSTYTVSSEIWGAVRWKDSTNFSTNFMITDSSIAYNNVLAQSGNDFMCINMTNDTICAVWGDIRNGFLNIWFKKIDLTSGAVSIQDLENDIEAIHLFPNPVKDIIAIDLGENKLENSTLKLLNITGEIIYTEKVTQQKNTVNLNNYPPGSYFIQFTNEKGSRIMKIIKQ